jgi:hypothetical protein
LPTPPLALHRDLAECPLAARGQNDTRPLPGELERRRFPYAARCTGDNDDKILQLLAHGCLLFDQCEL